MIAGREIFQKRKQLRSFNNIDDDHTFSAYKTTDVQVTSEPANPPGENAGSYFKPSHANGTSHTDISAKSYEPYTVNIAASIPMSPMHPMNPRSDRPAVLHNASMNSMHLRNRIAIEANTAAWGYTKVALLFFVSLLVTWVSEIFSSPGCSLVSFNLATPHYTKEALMLTMCFTGPILHQPRILADTSLVYACCLDLLSWYCTVPDGLLELGHIHHNFTCGLSVSFRRNLVAP